MGEWHHRLDGQEFDGQIDPLESKQKATALHEQTSQSSVTCLLLVASIGFQPTTSPNQLLLRSSSEYSYSCPPFSVH